MFYKVEYQKRAHQEVEKIFRVLLPEQGLAVREEQIRLCHEMLDTLLGERIALCDAGVGIGKTYAYLVACVLLRKYSMLTGRGNPLEQRPVVVSTSSIALQKAIVTEYIPFLSSLPFPMVEVWRHSQEEILRFKTMENGVLFAAGSCWEGVDFPGDMVSSLIIVKLPFAVPDPISEAEKETYESLEAYIQSIIVPDMQKRLRQGFGRAIRTETDTCVVSILDNRAVQGGKYHEDVLNALPTCQMAEELREVQAFIRSRKGVEYYL